MADDPRPTPAQRARRLLDDTTNLTLATTSPDGQPWVSPVFFVPDAGYDLYWTSEPTARHSRNIRATGRAAIVVVESDPDARVDAVYMAAEARELNDPEEVAAAIAVMAAKPQPDRWRIRSIDDVTGDGPWRIYRAHPTSIDVRTSAEHRGRAVARRRPAEFR